MRWSLIGNQHSLRGRCWKDKKEFSFEPVLSMRERLLLKLEAIFSSGKPLLKCVKRANVKKCSKSTWQASIYTPGQTWEKSVPNHHGKPLHPPPPFRAMSIWKQHISKTSIPHSQNKIWDHCYRPNIPPNSRENGLRNHFYPLKSGFLALCSEEKGLFSLGSRRLILWPMFPKNYFEKFPMSTFFAYFFSR